MSRANHPPAIDAGGARFREVSYRIGVSCPRADRWRARGQTTHERDAAGSSGRNRFSRRYRCRGRQGAGRIRAGKGTRQHGAVGGDPHHLRPGGTAAGQRGQPAASRGARRRQDLLRGDPRGHQRGQVRPAAGPRRPAADRGGRVPDDQPGDRRVHHRVRTTGLRRSDPARRDQPHPAEVGRAPFSRGYRTARSPSGRRPTSFRPSASRSPR